VRGASGGLGAQAEKKTISCDREKFGWLGKGSEKGQRWSKNLGRGGEKALSKDIVIKLGNRQGRGGLGEAVAH